MAERNIIAAVSTASDPDFVDVPLSGSKYSKLRYNATAMEAIGRLALSKFLSIPRGGLEVGGLLIGHVSGDAIEVTDSLEFSIEYASGPSYRLTAADEHALHERLRQTPGVVGWWHSHTRSEAVLSDEDLRVHREFFPENSSVALVVKPFKFDPAQVAVHLPNAASEAMVPCGRFEIDAPDTRKRSSVLAVSPIAQPEPIELAPVTLNPVVLPLTARPVAKPRHKKPVLAAACGVAVILLLGISWYSSRPEPVAPKAFRPMALSLSDSGNQLTVRWDRQAEEIRSSIGGELTVVDGSQVTRIPLGIDSLNAGSLAYVRRSGRVEVRLRTSSGANELHEAVAHFVGPEPEPVTVSGHEAAPPKEDANVKRMREEMERLNSELARMRSASTKQPTANVTPRETAARTAPLPVSAPPRQQQQQQPQASTASAALAVAPPTIQTPQFPAASPPVPSATPQAVLSTLPVTPPASTPAPAKQLATGRAIWTGALPRGGVLLLDGRKASAGALTGRMPDGPSRMRIYPADLRESGIVVYTQAGRERIEPPSAANGWNLTTYRPDAKRARDITVLESPDGTSNSRRVMVRSDQRALSMLVVEWEEVR